jgi:predicted transposase YbfD/YdcC
VDCNRRNRHETRTIAVFDATAAVAGTEWQPHVAAIIQVERDVNLRQADTGFWKPSLETSIYLSNRPVGAEIAADAIRKHWGIENTSHHTRDVTFREDASRIRTNPGIFARLRSMSYNVLRCNQSETMPQDRFAAALGGLEAVLAMVFSRER